MILLLLPPRLRTTIDLLAMATAIHDDLVSMPLSRMDRPLFILPLLPSFHLVPLLPPVTLHQLHQ